MANKQLLDYIKQVQSQGFPEETVRDVLLKNGWQTSDIHEAFSEIKSSEMALQMGAPLAPISSQSSSEPAASYNSPYSIGLAIVLIGALLILINKIIDDANIITMNVNGKLIFDALIIIPFLLVAFLLHGSFANTHKRYSILSQPYFVTSAFLLVRLLWDTSAYILDKNAAYGVYVVLILIIAVLTGVILFVQKYIKN